MQLAAGRSRQPNRSTPAVDLHHTFLLVFFRLVVPISAILLLESRFQSKWRENLQMGIGHPDQTQPSASAHRAAFLAPIVEAQSLPPLYVHATCCIIVIFI